MYARIENETVKEYPLSEGDIKPRFPNTSFTTNFSANLPSGYVRVLLSGVPAANDLKVVTEGTPVFKNGSWVQVWIESDRYTPEQLAEIEASKFEQQKQTVRDKRNDLLEKSDWTQLADTPVNKAVWATYRQALRDITSQAGFPWNVTWPDAPGA